MQGGVPLTLSNGVQYCNVTAVHNCNDVSNRAAHPFLYSYWWNCPRPPRRRPPKPRRSWPESPSWCVATKNSFFLSIFNLNVTPLQKSKM